MVFDEDGSRPRGCLLALSTSDFRLPTFDSNASSSPVRTYTPIERRSFSTPATPGVSRQFTSVASILVALPAPFLSVRWIADAPRLAPVSP